MSVHLPIEKIKPGLNDRKWFDKRRIEELADNIQAVGLLTPLRVRPMPDGWYEIVNGETRFRVCKYLGWTEVPCDVVEMDDEQASREMLAENTARANLRPMEEAEGFKSRMERYGWTMDYVARIAGVSVDLVRQRMKLFNLTWEFQHLVNALQLPIGHAEVLADLDHNRQRMVFKVWEKSQGMSLRDFKEVVRQYREAQDQESLFGLDDFWLAQVAVTPSAKSGRKARTNAPTRSDLPPVPKPDATSTTGSMIESYIALLLAQGKTVEAQTIGTLYNGLVQYNFVKVPTQSPLA